MNQGSKFDFLDMARKPQSNESSAKPSVEQKWEKAWSKKKKQPRALKKANAMRAIKEHSPPKFMPTMSTLGLDKDLVANCLVRHRQKKAEEDEM